MKRKLNKKGAIPKVVGLIILLLVLGVVLGYIIVQHVIPRLDFFKDDIAGENLIECPDTGVTLKEYKEIYTKEINKQKPDPTTIRIIGDQFKYCFPDEFEEYQNRHDKILSGIGKPHVEELSEGEKAYQSYLELKEEDPDKAEKVLKDYLENNDPSAPYYGHFELELAQLYYDTYSPDETIKKYEEFFDKYDTYKKFKKVKAGKGMSHNKYWDALSNLDGLYEDKLKDIGNVKKGGENFNAFKSLVDIQLKRMRNSFESQNVNNMNKYYVEGRTVIELYYDLETQDEVLKEFNEEVLEMFGGYVEHKKSEQLGNTCKLYTHVIHDEEKHKWLKDKWKNDEGITNVNDLNEFIYDDVCNDLEKDHLSIFGEINKDYEHIDYYEDARDFSGQEVGFGAY